MKKSEFNKFIAKVPKAELHIHIEAVITLDSVKKLYLKRFGKEMTEEEQKSLFTYNDLNGFIQAFLKVQDLFTSVEDFRLVFDDLGKYLKKNGITYCEAFFAPTAFLKKGFKYDEMVAVFHEKIVEIKEKTGIVIKLMEDVSRTFGCENAINNYNLQKQYPCEDIIGIGLGGAESKGPAKDYAPVYEMALADGKHAVIHAGEDDGPNSVKNAIKYNLKREEKEAKLQIEILEKRYKNKNDFGRKKAIFSTLVRYGFDESLSLELVNKLSNSNHMHEINVLKLDYDKCFLKYSKKYVGFELNQKITACLLSKGYRINDINYVKETKNEMD